MTSQKENEKAHIGLVTDVTTGEIDGTVTKGGLILITGHNIKIVNSEHGTTGCIFFISHSRNITVVNTPLLINEPGKLKFEVPSLLPPGEYTLKIKTLYSGKADHPRKRSVSMVYMLKLNIVG